MGSPRVRAQEMGKRLPLAVDLYPQQLRQQLKQALQAIAEIEPQADVEQSELEPALSAGSEELPETAPKLMTVCGFPHAGKDEVADHLQGRYRGVARFAFSDALIAEANSYLAQFGYQITPQNKSEPHYRLLLQCWGLGRRIEDPMYTAKQTMQRIQQLRQRNPAMIYVSGARIPLIDGKVNLNDLKLFWTLGGEVWLVVRPNNPYRAEHGVEAGLSLISHDSFDRVVYNAVEGNLSALHENIHAVLHRHPQPHVPEQLG